MREKEMRFKTRKRSIFLLFFLGISMFASSCSSNPETQAKASSLLLLQVGLKKEQLVSPNPERLSQMQIQGVDISNLKIQKIYVYLSEPLTPSQINAFQQIGVQVFLNSWIPPVGNNPDGFYLAEMPVDKLDDLASLDYVIKLDTAEIILRPQFDIPNGGLK
jgi:hypothetical protein